MRIKTELPSTIWRYDFPPQAGAADYELEMPASAQPIRVDRSDRGGLAVMWFLLNMQNAPGEEKVTRTFRIFGTGHEIPPGYRYLGSTPEAAFIWHVFEFEGTQQ